MLILNNGPLRIGSGGFLRLSTALTPPPVTPPSVPQDRVIGAYMNSLYYENLNYGSVPLWMDRFADADGSKSVQARGNFGFAQGWVKNPPTFDQHHVGVTKPGPDDLTSWSDVNATNFTDIIMVPDNFSGPPVSQGAETNPRLGGAIPEGGADDYVTEFEDCIDPFEANSDDEPFYWVYEGWAQGDQLINGDGSATSGDFADWRGRTTTDFGYSTWFDNLVAALKVDVPAAASRIGLIPVARVLVSVMEMTEASSMVAGDWFKDEDPHGLDSCYLIAAAITYATLFQEIPPQPDFTGATVHPAITSNWTAIALHIYDQVFPNALLGVADPTLSVNGGTFESWSTGHSIIDISKQMSAWDSAAERIDGLIAAGHVDAETTWITSTTLPGDFWKTLTVDSSDTFFAGKQYRMRWSGAGTMTIGFGGTIDSTSANEIIFTKGTGGLQVRATSGPITDLTIVDVNNAARFDAGERIDPDYAALVADMRMLRFMDWNYVNWSPQDTWASRPIASVNSYAEDGNGDTINHKPGIPIELMVELCNTVKADMYFCFPHAADDTYVTNAATYIRDNLDAALTCYFERSNEVWNFGFTVQQAHFLAMGQALWPDAVGVEDPQIIRLSALGYRTYQDAQLIDTVYAGILDRRKITLNVQANHTAQGIATLDATVWQNYAGNVSSTSGAYVAPHTAITHLATTSYFGTGLLSPGRMAAVEAAYPATSDALIDGYLRETGATGNEILSVSSVIGYWTEYNTIAANRGIKMLQYEGGPHMAMDTAPPQSQAAQDACAQWTESSLGTAVATELYDAWMALSEVEGPFMQFNIVDDWGRFGHWSLYKHMTDTPTGYMAQLLAENASGSNTWSDTTDYRHEEI